jgi:hypothetical protein
MHNEHPPYEKLGWVILACLAIIFAAGMTP